MTVQLGIFLALACALATNLGFLFKHRGACAAPDVDWKHPLASGRALFRSKWFTIGMLVAVGAWTLHVAAMALAPLSLVQAVISGGLVFLTVLAERFFGFSVGRRQWIGVGLTAVGLSLLAVTLPSQAGAHDGYSLAAMVAFEAGLLVVGTLLVISHKLGAPHHHHGLFLGTASGILFGVSDVAIKALTGQIGDSGAAGLLSPWLITCVIASVIAFFASARGLQKGEAVPVITLTAAAANVSPVGGGVIVFGGPLAAHPPRPLLPGAALLMGLLGGGPHPRPPRAA